MEDLGITFHKSHHILKRYGSQKVLLIIEESSIEEAVVSVGTSSQSIHLHSNTPQLHGVVAVDSEPEYVVSHLNGFQFRQVDSLS